MTFNYYKISNVLNDIASNGLEFIQMDDRDSLKKIIKDYEDIGLLFSYRSINCDEPLIQSAILLERDEMVMDLYMASPINIKQHMYKTSVDNLTIYADILGNAVINRRYKLVERLLDLKGIYKFHIDGMKNTNNTLLNFYHLIDRDLDQCFFQFNRDKKYITSPLMLAILIDDFPMYDILKNRGGYFNLEDPNCRFHLDYCKNEEIKKDILISFKNKEENR